MQLLRNIWEANNNAVKVLWQQQLDADREQQEHRQCLDEDEQDRLNQEKVEEEEAARKEERKKNKFKFIPILEAGIPDDPVITPCAYALKKLDKGEYVELWYFTNDGLDEAKHKKTVDDDAMILSTLADGSTAWVSAASTRSTRSVVNDENLPFEEFCQACPRFLSAIEEAEWPGRQSSDDGTILDEHTSSQVSIAQRSHSSEDTFGLSGRATQTLAHSIKVYSWTLRLIYSQRERLKGHKGAGILGRSQQKRQRERLQGQCPVEASDST